MHDSEQSLCHYAAPAFTQIQCADGGSDVVLGNQDTVTIDFDRATNIPAGTVWSHTEVLRNLNPSVGAGFGAALTATWSSSSRVVITVANAAGAIPTLSCAQVSYRVSTAMGLRDVFNRSAASSSVSSPSMVSGSFAITEAQGEVLYSIDVLST